MRETLYTIFWRKTEEKQPWQSGLGEMEKIKPREDDRAIWSSTHPHGAQEYANYIVEVLQGLPWCGVLARFCCFFHDQCIMVGKA